MKEIFKEIRVFELGTYIPYSEYEGAENIHKPVQSKMKYEIEFVYANQLGGFIKSFFSDNRRKPSTLHDGCYSFMPFTPSDFIKAISHTVLQQETNNFKINLFQICPSFVCDKDVFSIPFSAEPMSFENLVEIFTETFDITEEDKRSKLYELCGRTLSKKKAELNNLEK